MQLYRFSPIKTKEALLDAMVYEHTASSEMFLQITGETAPITSLTIFAHYPEEFEMLKMIQATMGRQVGEVLGPRVELHQPLTVNGCEVTHLRIRQPDPYHGQVGSNDYDIPDYEAFKARFLAAKPDNLRLLVRPNYELIEFWHPDFDVTGYVLSEPERSKR